MATDETTLRGAAERKLAALAAASRLRRLVPRDARSGFDGSGPIDLTTNDYLGLTRLAWFQEACRARARGLPPGSGGSRLLGGDLPIFGELEATFARWKGAESALFFPSGYAANEGLATSLARVGGDVAVFSDALNHASLIDGLRLTGLPKERRVVFPHGDLAALESALAKSTAMAKIVFTETVFSMDGDRADVPGIAAVCARHGATLAVDEAHATFVLDHEAARRGRGLAGAARAVLGEDRVFAVDTCGKAFGAAGAFVTGPRWLRDLLINTARSFIYTTAPSPWTAASLLVALEHDAVLAPLRERLDAIATYVRGELGAMGLDVGRSASAIVPVIVGSDEKALEWSAKLAARGVLARAIRPPTVPEGTARLRLSLSAGLTDGAVEQIVDAFASLAPRRRTALNTEDLNDGGTEKLFSVSEIQRLSVRPNALLITGTGTGIGKTMVSSLLTRGLALLGHDARYWKPVQTGAAAGDPDDDTTAVAAVAGREAIAASPVARFPLPASPDQAARAAAEPAPTIAALLAATPADGAPLLVEGAGGLLVPLNDRGETWADLLQETRWPALVVAATGLGTLNHTSLTLRELDRRGLAVAGVVLSGEAHDANLETLRRLFPTTRFHWLPRLEAPSDDAARALAAFVVDALPARPTSEAPAWAALDAQHAWHPYTQHLTAPPPWPVVAARGAHLTLASGERLLDGSSSWWVNNVGHGRPEIGAAIARQQATLDHVLFAGVTHEPAARLSAELAAYAGHGLSRVFYSDNGSTAVEVALKIAYQAWVHRGEPHRTRFLSFRGSYHGDTFGTMAVAAAKGFHGVFEPFLFETILETPVTAHRSALCPEGPAALDATLARIAEHLPRVAAVIVEPLIQGAGGMLVQPPEFLRGLAALCKQHGVPLILDEVLTGFCRVGAPFAFQRAGVEPDLICVAKGLTGGTMPLAATLARESFFDAFLAEDKGKALLHGHSFTANPIACAAALASLAIQRGERLDDRARAIEARYESFLAAEAERLGLESPRALGGILAFELPGTGGGDYFHPHAAKIPHLARAEGLFLRPLGNTVYLMPPLTVADRDLEHALAALARVVERLARS